MAAINQIKNELIHWLGEGLEVFKVSEIVWGEGILVLQPKLKLLRVLYLLSVVWLGDMGGEFSEETGSTVYVAEKRKLLGVYAV